MPKQPPAAENLTGWWKFGESQINTDDGGAVETVGDLTDGQSDFTQATAGNQPTLFFDQGQNRIPVVAFDGVDDFMEGPDLDDLIGNQGTVLVAFFSPSGPATDQTLISDSTGSNGRMRLEILTTGELRSFVTASGNDQIASTDLVQFDNYNIGIWWKSSAFLRVYVNDPLRYKQTATNPSAAFNTTRLGSKPNGTNWFEGYYGEILTYDVALTDANLSFVFAYLAARWLERGDSLAVMRDVGSRRVIEGERSRHMVEVTLPLSFRDVELLDPVAVSHERVPRATTNVGLQRWNRPIYNLVGRSEDLDAYNLRVRLADRDGLTHTWRESFISLYAQDPLQDGLLRSGQGAAVAYWRENSTWIENPGGGQITRVPGGQVAADAHGLVVERDSKNRIFRSSFVNGLTGLTQVGTGTNGSAIALDSAAPQMFAPDHVMMPTPQGARITAGSPHTVDTYLQWPASEAFADTDNMRLTIWRDAAVEVRLIRSTDGWYFNDTSGAWQAGSFWIQIPAPSAPGRIERWKSVNPLPGDGPAGFPTYQLHVGHTSGGIAGRTARVFHHQLEPRPYPSSVMVTTTAEFARGFYRVGRYERPDAHVFNEPHGTCLLRFTPNWDASDLVLDGLSAQLVVVQYQYPATDNYWIFFYNSTDARWELQVKQGANVTIAYIEALPSADTEYALAFRWTSDEEEHGLPANTLSVFLNGEKGTDAVLAERPTPIDYSSVWLGTAINGNEANGRIREGDFTALCLPDEDIAAWAAS